MPPGQEGKIELLVKDTDTYSGEVSKYAQVFTNDPKKRKFYLILRAKFKAEPSPAVPPPPPAGLRDRPAGRLEILNSAKPAALPVEPPARSDVPVTPGTSLAPGPTPPPPVGLPATEVSQ